jgi:3-isopropylmalate/(R)-2-methylmalate dehydratase small subunit
MAAGRDTGPVGDRPPRVPVRSGRAWAFTDNLGAADVLPIRFGTLSPADAARRLFADLDATLAERLAPGDVLVAGQNLGCGEGGAAAAAALAAARLGAVVAASFAPAFDEALLALDVPALAVDAPAIFHTGQRLRINIEAGTIANLSSGDRQPIRNLTEAVLERLRSRLGQ